MYNVSPRLAGHFTALPLTAISLLGVKRLVCSMPLTTSGSGAVGHDLLLFLRGTFGSDFPVPLGGFLHPISVNFLVSHACAPNGPLDGCVTAHHPLPSLLVAGP